jgi:hypothetical protein
MGFLSWRASPAGVDAPLDLDLVGDADTVSLVKEVTDDPAAVILAFLP